MALHVAGKYAIITGGGSGIGLAFAKKLLGRGCSVLIGDLDLRLEARDLVAQFPPERRSATKPVALFQKTDVTSWPQLSTLMRAGEAAFPQVDIVVPGAGVFEPAWGSFWNPPKTKTNPYSPSRDDANGEPGHYAVLDINLAHPIRLSQLAISHWTQRRIPGSLLIIGSMAGYITGIGSPLYFASKHGVQGFVRSLGTLRESSGIRTAAIAPGAVNTPIWSEDPDKTKIIRSDTIAATPEQVADDMLDLLENPLYGDGTILESTTKGTRVVPAFNAPPPDVEGGGMLEYEAEVTRLWREKITSEGLKV